MNDRVKKVVSILDEKKGENIQVFDMRDRDYFVDDVIIATTMGAKHGFSLQELLKDELKKMGEKYINIEESEEWIVIDLGDTLIHLMTPEYRTKYNLEEFLSTRESEKKEQN